MDYLLSTALTTLTMLQPHVKVAKSAHGRSSMMRGKVLYSIESAHRRITKEINPASLILKVAQNSVKKLSR
jgi:hypothetical protein